MASFRMLLSDRLAVYFGLKDQERFLTPFISIWRNRLRTVPEAFSPECGSARQSIIH